MPFHVSRKRFAELVEQALAELPPRFATAMEEMTLEIRDRPTRKELKSVGLDDDELLLGLYTGVPLTERSIEGGARLPDVIFVFQEDVELCTDTEAELIAEVRTTVLHEIGHYFGMSEKDLEDLGYG